MKPKEIPLESGRFYHVYNRGNNRDKLFYNRGNYEYFLRRYDDYLSDYVDTFAFCLLPNHFHLLIQVKNLSSMGAKVLPLQKLEPLVTPNIISKQFRLFFTSYSMSINKQQSRTGSLFQKNFKRIEITDKIYLCNLVLYIHANPQLHQLVDDFRKYPWSSYNRVLLNKQQKQSNESVIEWFGDKENYIACHLQKFNIEMIEKIVLE